MSIESKQQQVIEEFALFDDWMQKYEHLIELGKTLPLIDEKYRTDEYLVRGCQSRVWVHGQLDPSGNLVFTGDSDAIITRGLVALLIRVLSHEKPADIATADLHMIKDIGLSEHLSPTRSNGLAGMVKQMKSFAFILAHSGGETKKD